VLLLHPRPRLRLLAAAAAAVLPPAAAAAALALPATAGGRLLLLLFCRLQQLAGCLQGQASCAKGLSAYLWCGEGASRIHHLPARGWVGEKLMKGPRQHIATEAYQAGPVHQQQ
jgi:hypothetical protein